IEKIKEKIASFEMSNASKDDIIELGRMVNEVHDIGSKLGQKDEITSILGQYRPFGGKFDDSSFAKGSRKAAKNRLNEALSHYPSEWSQLLTKTNKQLFTGENTRGFFCRNWVTANAKVKSYGSPEFLNTMTIYLSGGSTVAYHELGHLVEYLHPDTLRISKEFVADRTKGEKDTPLADIFPGFGYGRNEVTKPD